MKTSSVRNLKILTGLLICLILPAGLSTKEQQYPESIRKMAPITAIQKKG